MANPIGTIPAIGGRLARDVFEPDLVMTDGEALLVANGIPLGVDDPAKTVEAWNPYRPMFDVVWSGRRHVMMGASQLDPYGNQNFAFIGDPAQPEGAAARHARRARQHGAERHQLLDPQPLAQGVRGARRRRVRHRVRPRRRARRLGARAPRAPARRHQPRRPRLRGSRPPHAAASACTPASPSTRWSRRPASSSPSTPTCPRRAPRPPRSSSVMARLDPRGLARPGGARLMHDASAHPVLRR